MASLSRTRTPKLDQQSWESGFEFAIEALKSDRQLRGEHQLLSYAEVAPLTGSQTDQATWEAGFGACIEWLKIDPELRRQHGLTLLNG
jgi:hypothetical protein